MTGQKDIVNKRAHLWVQNKEHTWKNVVDGVRDISGVNGTVGIGGFTAGTILSVEWHEFTTQGTPSIRSSTVTADRSGNVLLTLPTDPQIADVGIKIGEY